MRKSSNARSCRHHPLSKETEYPRAQLMVDVLDLFADRGFRDPEMVTGCYIRAFLCYCKNSNLPVHSDV
jgi:hypothetical protein